MLIARENLPRVLPHVQPRLERAIAEGNGEYEYPALADMLLQGRGQLWLGLEQFTVKMVGVTTVVTHPNVRRLRFELIEGDDFEGFMHHLEYLENWAMQFGVTEVEAFVRPGMGKKLRKIGFKQTSEVVIRPIERSRN